MCTISVECKTVIIAALTVMSSMDPHMISGNLKWVLVGLCRCGFLGYESVTVRLCDAIEVVIFEDMSSLLVY
jgi:hypothetical protein